MSMLRQLFTMAELGISGITEGVLRWVWFILLCRSVVHRLGDRETGARERRRDIDGNWRHDRFQQHDQLVSYPIQPQHREGKGGVREHTETLMDTI